MQGTLLKRKCGYKWMRIGHADARFSTVILLAAVVVMICLVYWAYRELAKTEWPLVKLLAIYSVAAILYVNLGVWLHEQLHCLPYRGTVPKTRTRILFERKFLLALSGHYRVTGAVNYRIQRRALLAPLVLSVTLAVGGGLGSFVLPGWWLPLLLTVAVASLLDMIHDFYMVSKIRPIGEKGKYWDSGRELDVVWKE
jgi:hypothetical protein